MQNGSHIRSDRLGSLQPFNEGSKQSALLPLSRTRSLVFVGGRCWVMRGSKTLATVGFALQKYWYELKEVAVVGGGNGGSPVARGGRGTDCLICDADGGVADASSSSTTCNFSKFAVLALSFRDHEGFSLSLSVILLVDTIDLCSFIMPLVKFGGLTFKIPISLSVKLLFISPSSLSSTSMLSSCGFSSSVMLKMS